MIGSAQFAAAFDAGAEAGFDAVLEARRELDALEPGEQRAAYLEAMLASIAGALSAEVGFRDTVRRLIDVAASITEQERESARKD